LSLQFTTANHDFVTTVQSVRVR